MEIGISIHGMLTTGIFRGAGNSEVIYVVILRRVPVHGAVIGGGEEDAVGPVDFGHFRLGILNANPPAVGIAEEGALERRHRLSRTPHVHVLHKRHWATSFRVQAQSAETRKAGNSKQSVSQNLVIIN